jgi:uncharacterized protein YneR
MPELIAEAWVDAGYSISYYDEETNECVSECYASVAKVIQNKEYWYKFDEYMDTNLNAQFELGFCFDRFHIKVYNDGSYAKEEITCAN